LTCFRTHFNILWERCQEKMKKLGKILRNAFSCFLKEHILKDGVVIEKGAAVFRSQEKWFQNKFFLFFVILLGEILDKCDEK